MEASVTLCLILTIFPLRFRISRVYLSSFLSSYFSLYCLSMFNIFSTEYKFNMKSQTLGTIFLICWESVYAESQWLKLYMDWLCWGQHP